MKHLLLFMALLVSTVSFSQIVNIPDPLFKQRLVDNSNINTNADGEIQVSEAEAYDGNLNVGNSEFTDLTGIEAFINIISISGQNAQFTIVDLSNNSSLETIGISNSALEEIIPPSNVNILKQISIFGTQISDVSFIVDYPNLISLGLNFIESLNEIDISNNLLLESLGLSGTNITVLDVSNNSSLRVLNITNTNLSSIDLANVNLESLGIGNFGEVPSMISSFDLSGQTNLETLEIRGIVESNINLSNNNNLNKLTLTQYNHPNIDLSNNILLNDITVSRGDLENLNLSNLSNLIDLRVENVENLNPIILTSNGQLENLSLVRLPQGILDLSQNINLKEVYLDFLETETLNLSTLINLESLELYIPTLNDLTLPNSNSLLAIRLFYSEVEELDLSSYDQLNLAWARYNNNLTSLNLKNGNTANLAPQNGGSFSVRLNPNLNFVCVDDAPFAAANFTFVSPYITFTEDCSLTSNDLNQIQGVVSYDMANNGCTTGNLPLDGFIVSSSDGTNTFANGSNNGGNYNINLSENTYTTSMVGLPVYFEATPATVSDTFVGFNQVEEQDFCVQATVTANDLNVSINPQYAPVPGGTGLYSVVYQNAGTTELAASVTLIFEEDKMTFDSAEPAPTSQTNNSLTWDLGILPVFTTAALDVRFDLEGALVIGTPLEFSASIEPIAGDATPEDNEFTMFDFVDAAPFAENMAVPQGAEELIEDAGNYLNYVVNFENNTGNTVQDILISTILSNNLDVTTLQIINSSHPVTVQLYNNEVYFNLEGINLPDSEGTQGSGGEAGYVMYRARPISGIAVGDVVSSSAIIFLDGAPVFTNNVNTRFVDVLDTPSFNNLEIGLYPNPTTGIFHITSTETIENVTMYNISGQQLKRVEGIQQNETILNIEALAAGIYFANVKTAQGTKIFRVLKQ